MRKIKLIVGFSLLLCLSACKGDIVELDRIASPTGQLEAIFYDHRGEGDFRILVVRKGEKLTLDRDPDYPNVAVVSGLRRPVVVQWLNNCDLLVEVKKRAVRHYSSTQSQYCTNKKGKVVTGQVYLIFVPQSIVIDGGGFRSGSMGSE